MDSFNVLTIFILIKILTDFALKENYKRLQSIENKLAEIDSLIDWKPFHIIFESIYFKRRALHRPKANVIVMFKMLVLQQWNGLSDFEIEKQYIDRIYFRKFFCFPEYIPDSAPVWLFRKKAVDNCKEEEIWGQLQSQLNCLGFENKNGTYPRLYFYLFRSWACKIG